MLESALESKTLKDGLSGPLTIAHMIVNWMSYNRGVAIAMLTALDALDTGGALHIVVVGATAVYEEVWVRIRVLSDCWRSYDIVMSFLI